jgi:phospholipase C
MPARLRITRRQLLAAGALGGAGVALQGLSPAALRALAAPAVCGSLNDIEHVVILIQENRAFDHYFGSYRGVRGFADPAAPVQSSGPNAGLPVFYQYAAGTTFMPPANTLTPFHIDSTNNGECTNDITHEWVAQHSCWNGGAMDSFLATHVSDDPVNGPMTMGHYTRADMDFYYALADAFTLCDGHHCSVIGPTDSNRLYSMSATFDPDGANGGPWLQTLVSNRPQFYGSLTWTTYPEQLQSAGITWKVYADPDASYGDNVLNYFKNYNTDPNLAANAFTPTFPGEFEADCAAGTLPQVSWVLAPLIDTEHPPAPTEYGEWVSAQVLNALTGNAALWASTVLFITHDENGGFFDHVPPPTPPPGTPGEYITTSLSLPSPRNAGGVAGPIGLGFRVPLLVCSPFSRGGFVCSETFDHTSLLLFLERRFGPEVPNISAWRRSMVGDLTAALNMAAVDASVPSLPATSLTDPRVIGSDCPTSAPADEIDQGLPAVQAYPVPQPNTLPAQEAGSARTPSGLSCSAPANVPAGPPVLLVAGAAALAGIGAFARRRARVRAEAQAPAASAAAGPDAER